MIARLPRWVWTGAWVLAFIAGVVNVVGLLGFDHEAITHMTGNTTRLGAALATRDYAMIVHILALIGSFFIGAVVSGFLIQDSTLQLDRRYSVALLIESALLAASVPLLGQRSLYGMCAAAGAIGMQNAMVSAYSGAVVRTSHVSGMVTDLGISLGHAARGLPVNMKRVWLCISVISGFLAGGVAGTLVFERFSYATLFFPAALTAVVAIGYAVVRTHRNKK